jgi:hypothetical protein
MEMEQVRLSADQLRHLSTTWSPWLDICHFILSTLAVREEVGLAFSRYLPAVFRIHRIHMFLGLPDPDTLGRYIFKKLCKCTCKKVISRKTFFKFVFLLVS